MRMSFATLGKNDAARRKFFRGLSKEKPQDKRLKRKSWQREGMPLLLVE
jgi:hypothetical protein